MEGHPPHVGPVHFHLHGHGELVLARTQRARTVGERLGQHRLDRAGHVDAGAAAHCLALERPAGAQVRGHVGDVHPGPYVAVLSAGGDRVIEVLGVARVDRERGECGEIHAGIGRVGLVDGVIGLRGGRPRVGAVEPAVQHQPLEHVACPPRAAQPPHHPRAALAGAHEH